MMLFVAAAFPMVKRAQIVSIIACAQAELALTNGYAAAANDSTIACAHVMMLTRGYKALLLCA